MNCIQVEESFHSMDANCNAEDSNHWLVQCLYHYYFFKLHIIFHNAGKVTIIHLTNYRHCVLLAHLSKQIIKISIK